MTEDPKPVRLLLTVEEAAEQLAIARSHLYLLIQRGQLRTIRIGRCRRIAIPDLEAFVERLREDQQPPVPALLWR